MENAGATLEGMTPGLHRVMAWIRSHVIITDTFTAALALLLVIGADHSIAYDTGLLFSPSPPIQTVWSALLILPMALRRRFPRSSALAYAALAVLQLLFGPCLLISDLFALVMLYSVIVYGDPRVTRRFILLAGGVGAFAALAISWSTIAGPLFGTGADPSSDIRGSFQRNIRTGQSLSDEGLDAFLQTLGFGAAAIAVCLLSTIVLAFWQRARLLTIRMLRERNTAIAARENEERTIAALAERARIARDMHDVVAHTLSIIIVQSDGGRYAGAHDPVVARRTMETIRHESERALHDMNRLLNVFDDSSHAGYADIGALIEQARVVAPDTVISRSIFGTPTPERLSSEANVAVYHVMQEALTNIRKYAGSCVHVTIIERWSSGNLRIGIDDDGRGASVNMDGHKPGYGLLGMRERLEAVGGSVRFGPRAGGGFSVKATVPCSVPFMRLSPAGAVSNGTTCDTLSANPDCADEVGSRSHESRTPGMPDCGSGTRPTAQLSALPRLPKLPKLPSFSTLCEQLQAKPIAQADSPHGGSFNWIERLSRWTQRHYVMVDTITAGFLIVLFGLFPGQRDSVIENTRPSFLMLLMFLEMLPLCVRRRFPEGAAAAVACLSSLQLLLYGNSDLPNVISALCALYSAVLYGRRTAWRWTGLAVLFNSLLLGCSLTVSLLGYPSIVNVLLRRQSAVRNAMSPSFTSATFIGMLYALMLFMLCIGVMAMALWTRSNDSNTMVLQAREEALLAKEAKQRVMAANVERNRISANIQSEVTATLNSVIEQAAEGIRMLDETQSHGSEPAPDAVAAAFKAIGEQGRVALKRMRELLSMLRETGFSDAARASGNHELRLRPTASLDEQIRSNTLHTLHV